MGDASTRVQAKVARSRSPPVRRVRPAPVRDRAATIGSGVQRALRVGAANDPMEREAEATAERVVTMSAPGRDAAPVNLPDGPRGGPRDAASRLPRIDQESQPDTSAFDNDPPIPADHRDPDVPSSEDVDTEAVTADAFAEIEAGEPEEADGGDGGEDIQRAPGETTMPAVGAAGGDAPADVGRAVAQPGAGRPLPASVRDFMEPRFGADFSAVRIHDDPADRRTAERIGARAFTYRDHIWMGEGETVENRRLMAHELTHVVQQTGTRVSARRAPAPEIRRGYLRDKAEKIARNVPGYTLLCVIIGKSPITGDKVARTAENLIGGFLGLLPGGNLIFEKLQETRALQRAYEWVSSRLSELDITWTRIKGLISDFIDEMPAWSPLKIAKRIFAPLVEDILTFVREIKDKILEFIVRGALSLAGSWGEKVWGVIEKVRDVISLILNDPLGFAKNLVRAVVAGFGQFGERIWTHLKKGLMGWLFGTLQGMEIDIPERLDFRGIVSVALQILGLTYAEFRKTLVKKLGTSGERKVAYLERSVKVVRTLVAEGFLGIYQRVVEMIDGFKGTVIDGIRDFVIETVIGGALSWIAGLSNPIGAIVKVALAIYKLVKTFLERLDDIVELAGSIFSSLGNIAKGQVKEAADFIETTIARTIPVFLAFVAAMVPVSGITASIRSVIKQLQAPVKRAMERMLAFLVKKAKKLFSKILAKINRKRKVPAQGFVVGSVPHKLVPVNEGGKFVLRIASEKPRDADEVQAELKTEAAKAAGFGDDSKCFDAFEAAFEVEVDEAQASLAKVKPEQRRTPTKKTGDKAAADVKDAGSKLAKLGPCIADNPFLEDDPKDGAIIRAREPRIEDVEGAADLYASRRAVTKQTIDSTADKAGLGPRGLQKLSNYYENDHVPEKSLGFKVQDYVQGEMRDEIAEGQRDGKAVPEPYLGEVDTRALGKSGEQLPAITLYRPIHRQKTASDAKDRDHGAVIAEARKEVVPAKKIARLRAGVVAEMQSEMTDIAGRYSDDPAATKAIRANVKAGMGVLGTLNETLFGTTAGQVPELGGGPETGEGSDLPMEGDPKSGLPDFADVEGLHTIYGAAPKGVGNYLEFDHVVEKSLAEKSRDLRLSHPAFSGDLADAVDRKAAAAAPAAAAAGPDAVAADPSAKTPEAIAATGKRRIAALRAPAFSGGGVLGYDAKAAGTVALYRPVHREVTAKQTGVRGDILKGVDLTDARAKLVDWAVSEPKDDSLKDTAVKALRSAVRARFVDEIGSHTAAIRDAYKIELKDFLRINRSKLAGAKMATVIERVGATLRTLRSDSLSLVS